MSAPTTTTAPLLDVTDLVTRYANSVYPVRGISLQLKAGDSLGIVGESGSGKSVLLKSIIGVHPRNAQPHVSGTVRIAGESMLDAPPRRHQQVLGTVVGVIHQDPLTSLNPLKRTVDQVLEAPRSHGEHFTGESARQRVSEVLKSVGFANPDDVLDKYPHQMSGGQRQRVGIAAAVVNRPNLVFADEPTTALDVTVQAQVLDLLTQLCRENHTALVLVTHDLAIVGARCERIAVMYGGRIVELAKSSDLINNPQHPYTFGLLAARPRLHGPLPTRLASIPGTAVPPSRPLAEGCPFAGRCPLAIQKCRTELPALISIDGQAGHHVACWQAGQRPDFSTNLVPSNTQESSHA